MTHSRLLCSTMRLLAAGAAVFGISAPAQAQFTVYTDVVPWTAALSQPPSSINFDDLPDLAPLVGVYAGVSFSAFNFGSPQVAAYNFAHSGSNVVSLALPVLTGGGGGLAMNFASGQQGVAFWYLDSEFAGNGVALYGGANQLLGSFEMVYPNPNPIGWRFVGFVDAGSDIRRVEVAIGAADMVALDSLQLSAAVPEPASAALLLAGLLLLASRRGGHRAWR